MPTNEQRREDQRINALALRLCQQWQESQRRQYGFYELGAFMAGVVAAERERVRVSALEWPRIVTEVAAGREKTVSEFEQLRRATIDRGREYPGNEKITPSFRGNELAGEVGEACNVIKKLERARLGIAGSQSSVDALADELADIIICVDLIAAEFDIDVWYAVIKKFNTSTLKLGLSTFIKTPVSDDDDA